MNNEKCSVNQNPIWLINDINKFIIEMDDWIGEKCGYCEYMYKLNKHEKIFYINQIFEREVNNGGFLQFIYNMGDDFTFIDVLNSLREIGANKTIEIFENLLNVIGRDFPLNQHDKNKLLEKVVTNAVSNKINELSMQFYSYPDNLNALNYQYIINNKEMFGWKHEG